jgi:hypothetical protein
VTGDKAELKYTIPLSKEGQMEESLGVTHIVFSNPIMSLERRYPQASRLSYE